MTSTSQRMSDKRLAKLKSRMVKGLDSYELVPALIAERAVVGELSRGLRSCDCPFPLMPDRTIGTCFDTGMCGCVHSTQLQSAIHPIQEPKDG